MVKITRNLLAGRKTPEKERPSTHGNSYLSIAEASQSPIHPSTHHPQQGQIDETTPPPQPVLISGKSLNPLNIASSVLCDTLTHICPTNRNDAQIYTANPLLEGG